MAPAARKPHLYRFHEKDGRLIDYAGFRMPVWYTGIPEEHLAVRNAAGAFDVSHMGRIDISGPQASEFLNYVLPSDVAKVSVGRAFYSTLCNEAGGIVDDTVSLKLSEEHYLMVVNAINRGKDFQWLKKHAGRFRLTLKDMSDEMALIALQGPKAEAILQSLTATPLAMLKRFNFVTGRIAGFEAIISRTGYTGEDGFELFLPDCPISRPEKAETVWNLILEKGHKLGCMPCGLGARDTLRLEAGLCLYGQDFDDSTTPLEAGLSWIIAFDKPAFIGRRALTQQREQGVERTRVALAMQALGIPRTGCSILRDSTQIGAVTSGTYSPLLKKGIGMGYVPPDFGRVGENVKVEIRGSLYDASIAGLPFYDPGRYGAKRVK